MKKLLLLATFCFTAFGLKAQTTAIPDNDFEQRLIDLSLDDVIDGSVLTSNINGITTLIVSNTAITDLTGIEDFESLTTLDISNTAISSLDLSNHVNLVSLMVFNNSSLTELNIQNGANTILNQFNSTSTPNLTCIQVDDVAYANTTWNNVDNANSFSTDCSGTAFNFDGIDDYAVAINPSVLDITTGTIEMRIKPQTKTTKQITIPFAFNEDQWYNIAVTDVDSGFTRLYIDGEFTGTFASEFGTATGSNLNLYVGVDFPLNEYFKGDIGDIRIWNTIKEDGTASCTPSASGADLLAYYNFNQGVDSADNFAITTVTDQTSNANNLQLTNVALTGITSNWVNTDNTIFDTGLPIVFTQDITINLTCSEPVTILPEDVDNFSGDSCGIASLSLDIDTFD